MGTSSKERRAMLSSYIRSVPWCWTRSPLVFMLCICVVMILLLVRTLRYRTPIIYHIKMTGARPYLEEEERKFPDVLQRLTHGRWLPVNVSTEHKLATRLFYRTARGIYGIPFPTQRQDGMCGDVSFPGHSEFRAICDADGANPCCWQGRCTNRTIQECQCPGCLDCRSKLFAEDFIWTPYDSSCRINSMYDTASQVCSALHNTSILFVGDSLMRQTYMTVLWMTSGDWKLGAMKPHITKDIRTSCSGINMFIDKTCRFYLEHERMTCDSKTKLQFLEIYKVMPGSTKTIIDHLTAMPPMFKKALVIGIGLHEQTNFLRISQRYLDPVLQNLNCTSGRICPKLLWVAPQCPGLLKSTSYTGQQAADIIRFTSEMKQHLNQTNMALLDPFNLTRDVHTIDGTHAALAVNLVKAKIILYFIDEVNTNNCNIL